MARVSRGKVYALIDLKDGFYQLQISPQASEYCAVTLPFGLYEITRLVMGWTNAPANFQRKINQMLAWGITNKVIKEDTVEAYVDDLLVYAEDMPSLFIHVNNLIQLLLHFNMAIIPTKCHFGVTSAKYLGFILIPGGKTLSQQITDRIKEKLHNIWLETQDETDETKIVTYTQRIIGTLVYFSNSYLALRLKPVSSSPNSRRRRHSHSMTKPNYSASSTNSLSTTPSIVLMQLRLQRCSPTLATTIWAMQRSKKVKS